MHPMISQHQIITGIYSRLIPGYQALGLLIHGPWSPQMGLENLSTCKEWRCTVFDDLTSLMTLRVSWYVYGADELAPLCFDPENYGFVSNFGIPQEFHGLQNFPHINIAHFDGSAPGSPHLEPLLRQERFKIMSNLQMLMWSMNITSTSAPEGGGINFFRVVLKCGTPQKNVSGHCTPFNFLGWKCGEVQKFDLWNIEVLATWMKINRSKW